jgi:hypothetical protein
MTTRTIVTSQPDVECDVCERRLLRGEQPDIFLAAGRRRTVCELCAPRAAHEGWLRESGQSSVELPPTRARRGRSLFERLKQAARPLETPGPGIAAPARAGTDYDLLDATAGERPARSSAQPVAAGAGGPAPAPPAPEPPRSQWILEKAIEVFNSGEYPRRVSGVARSLGEPVINIRSAEHHDEVVRIVVAWELCWYRYEVDLADGSAATAVAAGQGTELAELAREEHEGNATAADSGALALAIP